MMNAMINLSRRSVTVLCGLLASLSLVPGTAHTAAALTVAQALADAPAADWRSPAPEQTVVMTLPGGRQVLIELAPGFAPRHTRQIAQLVHAGWYDGLAIARVNDNYVTQWGDADATRALPEGQARTQPAEFLLPALPGGAHWLELPGPDSFARHTGLVDGWPAARNRPGGPVWLAHCYGMVGAGRDNAADSGSVTELYAVIGHSPRQLDRNVTLVGRVLQGIEHLAALPRGTAAMGFYATPAERTPLLTVRLLADLPAQQRPDLQVLRTDSPGYARWLAAKRERREDWFVEPGGHIDLCNALPPVRQRPAVLP